MAYLSATRDYFQKKFGVSLQEAAGNPEVVQRLRAVNGEKPNKISMQEEDFGRGHVFLKQSVSAEQADRETLRMFSRWSH